ncbi:MAG: Elongation factor 1-beta [Methanocella sp. PtaU1.Bin125]|nr:MAG: Elongation factor 1-beta [Methanocella sp. PtaU1.Bin125]
MAVLRIMPDSTDRDLKKLEEDCKAAMPKSAKLQGVQTKPIAFGLKALLFAVTVNDAEGGTEALEQAWAKVPGVESVNVEMMDRV